MSQEAQGDGDQKGIRDQRLHRLSRSPGGSQDTFTKAIRSVLVVMGILVSLRSEIVTRLFRRC